MTDIYTEMASRVFQVPPDQITKDQRQATKHASYMYLYGWRPKKKQLEQSEISTPLPTE